MRPRLWLVLSVCVSGITLLYLQRVLQPWSDCVDAQRGIVHQMGDLFPRWMGTRELLLHQQNPYGPKVSHQIQTAFYGHGIDQEYEKPAGSVIDEQRFVYPVYVVFLLAPTIWLSVPQLQLWMAILFGALTAFSVYLWLELLHWRPAKTIHASIVLFILGSPQIVQGLRLRQLGLLVGFLIAVSAWCVTRNHLASAGILLAVATVKPQMAILPIVWLLLWALSARARRWPLLVGFGTTMIGLCGLGDLILPGWLHYFLEGVLAYRRYAQGPSLLSTISGKDVGVALSVVVIAGLLALAWKNRQADAHSTEFLQTLVAFLIGATLVLPLLPPFNQVLLLLPALMIIRDWSTLPGIARKAFVAIVAWPWVCSLVLLYRPPHLDSQNPVPLLPAATVLFVPFLFLLLSFRRQARS